MKESESEDPGQEQLIQVLPSPWTKATRQLPTFLLMPSRHWCFQTIERIVYNLGRVVYPKVSQREHPGQSLSWPPGICDPGQSNAEVCIHVSGSKFLFVLHQSGSELNKRHKQAQDKVSLSLPGGMRLSGGVNGNREWEVLLTTLLCGLWAEFTKRMSDGI